VQIEIETDAGTSLDAIAADTRDRTGLVVPPVTALDGVAVGGSTRAIVREGEPPRTRAIVFRVYRARVPNAMPTPSKPVVMHAPGVPGEPRGAAGTTDKAAAERWVECEPHVARVWLVDTATFTQETGVEAPGPMREEDTYRGWRVP
jgi:hypothetical protein